MLINQSSADYTNLNHLTIGALGLKEKYMNCPKCQGSNTQTIKMVVMSGTSTKNTTILAESLHPGSKPITGEGCLTLVMCSAGVVGVFAVSQGGVAVGFMFILLAFGIKRIAKILRAKLPSDPVLLKYELRSRLYESGWICHSCGETWLPPAR